MKKISLIVSSLIVLISSHIFATPAQVIIIRHAEKPPKGSNFLNTKGMERAQALMPYFLNTAELLEYGAPIAIYAQKPIPDNPSHRPIQTCEPTAQALKLKVLTPYSHDEYATLVKEILKNPLYNGKMVLICWEHHAIPQIAKQFGVEEDLKPWPANVFDRTWVITFNDDGSVKSFKNLPQRLMYGDSKN